ncbi:MAG: carbamoyl-phosphate synthase large subunit [Bacillota bacterium]
MACRPEMKKILVIGSGPIVIGQAAEFDYAGTQACRALTEEGLLVVLVNPNPATIMTDVNMADRIYLEPLTAETVERIIEAERPDGLLPTLGGQVGLNLAVELAEAGILDRYGVRLLGTPLEAIRLAEDRKRFKELMTSIGEPVPESVVIHSTGEALSFAQQVGYPVVVRPAYTLGGTGGGMASDPEELAGLAHRGLAASPIGQVLIEKLVGWKEIEYEVIRDGRDNCIAICNMENFDPMGIHTGDSIVVAPSQTLSDRDYQRLRQASLKIIRALGIEGGCNVQLALNPSGDDYYVIEVNPRVSRSSALASKATGYPIARVAAKIAAGFSLDEIRNPVTGSTYACFEPALDYVVVKIPRWPFDKFRLADRRLGTQMKATGEVMAISRSFEAALNKAVRSLDVGEASLFWPVLRNLSDREILEAIQRPDDRRLFLLVEALSRGIAVEELRRLSGIDRFFLDKLRHLTLFRQRWAEEAPGAPGLLREAKQYGLSDRELADCQAGSGEKALTARRVDLGISPAYKMVDTCAGEFAATTPYFYSTYEEENEAEELPGRKVIVLGSGPIRIGQGIEFDYCSVHAAWALREEGFRSIIVNNNPETVSTDFNTSDRLYFEPLTFEDVMDVVRQERPEGVIAQFGGQTAINLAIPLEAAGVRVLGTSADSIDLAEDRRRFDDLLHRLGIARPPGGTAQTAAEAVSIADQVGYPVVVRPSYVLGGRAMEIVGSRNELIEYLATASQVSGGHPVLIDRYLEGREVDTDAVCDGQEVLVAGIMEHVERAGVHSGDSIAVYPPRSLSPEVRQTIVDCTTRLALALGVKGLMNIQFVVSRDEVYVLEVNPRSSRTVPFLSKMTGIPLVALATKVILGRTLRELGYKGGLAPEPPRVGVKLPVFSWAKLADVDTTLGPEMKSTGEVMGLGESYTDALAKAFAAGGYRLPPKGAVLFTIADRHKDEATTLAARFIGAGFQLVATEGTARALEARGISVEMVHKVSEQSPHIGDLIRQGRIGLVINTLTRRRGPISDGFRIRRITAEHGVPCLTSLDTAEALLEALERLDSSGMAPPIALQDHLAGR